MKEFEFNESDVCLNPNTYTHEGGFPHKYLIEVTTALGDNGWVYGTSYNTAKRRGNSPIWKSDKDAYMTEDEAGRAGLKSLRRKFESIARREYEEQTEVRSAREALAIIDMHLNNLTTSKNNKQQ